MTRTSIREYTEAVRWRYLRSPKTEKGKILDEFTKVTGYHRKAAIHLLHLTFPNKGARHVYRVYIPYRPVRYVTPTAPADANVSALDGLTSNGH